jgi:hypothetical protein
VTLGRSLFPRRLYVWFWHDKVISSAPICKFYSFSIILSALKKLFSAPQVQSRTLLSSSTFALFFSSTAPWTGKKGEKMINDTSRTGEGETYRNELCEKSLRLHLSFIISRDESPGISPCDVLLNSWFMLEFYNESPRRTMRGSLFASRTPTRPLKEQ